MVIINSSMSQTQISPIWLQLIDCTWSGDCKTTIKYIGLIPLILNRPMNLTHTCEEFLMLMSCQSAICCNVKIHMIMLLLNSR